jgi:hypothetical protein
MAENSAHYLRDADQSPRASSETEVYVLTAPCLWESTIKLHIGVFKCHIGCSGPCHLNRKVHNVAWQQVWGYWDIECTEHTILCMINKCDLYNLETLYKQYVENFVHKHTRTLNSQHLCFLLFEKVINWKLLTRSICAGASQNQDTLLRWIPHDTTPSVFTLREIRGSSKTFALQ